MPNFLIFVIGAVAFCTYPLHKLGLPSIIGFFMVLWVLRPKKLHQEERLQLDELVVLSAASADVSEEDSAELKTPDEWCKILKVYIKSPDGWRGKDYPSGRDCPSWDTPITKEEFLERADQSTTGPYWMSGNT